MTDLGEHELAAWARRMRAEGLSIRTFTEWPRIVRRAARTVGADPRRLTTDDVIDYLAGLPSASTRQTYWTGLRAWHRWLVDTGRRADDPMATLRRPRGVKGEPHPVATDHLAAVLDSRIRRRTRTAIYLGALQGLRVHEIARVRGEDVDLISQRLRVFGKGRKVRWMPLHPILAAEAEDYPRQGWWFPSHVDPSRPVHRESLSATISRAMQRAGVPGTAHSLRHWIGTELTRGGTPTRVVQETLRHASAATTQIYTLVADEQVRQALLSLPIPTQRAALDRGAAPMKRTA